MKNIEIQTKNKLVKKTNFCRNKRNRYGKNINQNTETQTKNKLVNKNKFLQTQEKQKWKQKRNK